MASSKKVKSKKLIVNLFRNSCSKLYIFKLNYLEIKSIIILQMANQWITFIKQWANSHQMSYGCALSDPEMKAEYHKRFPKKLTKKAMKAMSQLEESKPEGNVKAKATFPNLKIKIPEPDENMQLMVTEIKPTVPRPKKVKSKKLNIVPAFDIVEEPTKQIPKMEVYRRGDTEVGFVPKFIKLDLTNEEIKNIKRHRKNPKVAFYKPPFITEAYDEFMKQKNDKGEVPSWISMKRRGRANDEYFIINNRAMVWGYNIPYGVNYFDKGHKSVTYTPNEMNEKYFNAFNRFNEDLKNMDEKYMRDTADAKKAKKDADEAEYQKYMRDTVDLREAEYVEKQFLQIVSPYIEFLTENKARIVKDEFRNRLCEYAHQIMELNPTFPLEIAVEISMQTNGGKDANIFAEREAVNNLNSVRQDNHYKITVGDGTKTVFPKSKPEEKRKVKGGMIPNNEKTDKQLRGEIMHMAKNFKNLEEMEGSEKDKESDFHTWGFNALDALSNLSKSYASERAIQQVGELHGSFHPVFRNAIKDLASHYVENNIPFM
jgi:hypothetical protein